jgi:serine/threonine-protein kinase HipA
MTERLNVVLDGQILGYVDKNDKGRLSFSYELNWISSDARIPLSLSMPLSAANHKEKTIADWMANLLPDNAVVIEGWKRKHRCGGDPFSLLSAIWEDCPGAVQFLRDDNPHHSGMNSRGWT